MKKIVVTAFFEGKKKDGGSCSDSIRFIYDESIEALPALLESKLNAWAVKAKAVVTMPIRHNTRPMGAATYLTSAGLLVCRNGEAFKTSNSGCYIGQVDVGRAADMIEQNKLEEVFLDKEGRLYRYLNICPTYDGKKPNIAEYCDHGRLYSVYIEGDWYFPEDNDYLPDMAYQLPLHISEFYALPAGLEIWVDANYGGDIPDFAISVQNF